MVDESPHQATGDAKMSEKKMREVLEKARITLRYGCVAGAPMIESTLAAIESVLAEQPTQGEEATPADVQRVINRLMSSDPNFDDCEEAAAMLASFAKQPVPSVPDEQKLMSDSGPRDLGFVRGWNACRAAMLAAAPQVPS